MSSTPVRAHRNSRALRTRAALVDAALERIRNGEDFSLGDVAEDASVSLATAYRYFPSREALYTSAALSFAGATDEGRFRPVLAKTNDPALRVDAVVEVSDRSTTEHHAEYRAMLRTSLRTDHSQSAPARGRHRNEWLTEALAPVRSRVPGARFEKLVAALGLCMGIEAHITLTEVSGLAPAEARKVKRWAAQAILRAALDEGGDRL